MACRQGLFCLGVCMATTRCERLGKEIGTVRWRRRTRRSAACPPLVAFLDRRRRCDGLEWDVDGSGASSSSSRRHPSSLQRWAAAGMPWAVFDGPWRDLLDVAAAWDRIAHRNSLLLPRSTRGRSIPLTPAVMLCPCRRLAARPADTVRMLQYFFRKKKKGKLEPSADAVRDGSTVLQVAL